MCRMRGYTVPTFAENEVSWLAQENLRLSAECKEAKDLAAERLALLKDFKALSQQLHTLGSCEALATRLQ